MNKLSENSITNNNNNNSSIILYHGSGTLFNEFSLDKVGSGIGNNGFGYGVYLTDSKSSAKQWANTLEKIADEVFIDDTYKPSIVVREFLSRAVKTHGSNNELLLIVLKSNLDNKNEKISVISKKEYDFLKNAKKLSLKRNRILYTVKVSYKEFINFDSLLSGTQLDKIKKQAQKENLIFGDKIDLDNPNPKYIAKDLYTNLNMTPKKASEFLYRCGFTGFAYFEGTFTNYVIFNTDSINIVSKIRF